MFGIVQEVRSETAAGFEVFSELDGVSLLSVQLEQQAGVFWESCRLTHISSDLKVEIRGKMEQY